MQEASLTGIFKTLCYIIGFYYIFKFLAKLFLPILVKKAVEKAGENFQKQQNYSQQTNWNKTKSADEIIIDTSNVKTTRQTKKVGDYVDYEEID
ncbi:DUF4834 family protein [Flavobacterium eburneipallidum]|uniref:DUF4834 family protein n=1 Tax=Flavobacterium eburneipallidum TaxID=3003263 RepID=UPI0022AC8868|nr:DUF4834 family protein [Flavobacterium eburneipallidum]